MTFPAVAASTNGVAESATALTHTVNLPASISAGDLLVIIIASNPNPGTLSASGWTFLSSDNVATTGYISLGYKTATGSEGASVTVNSVNSTKSCKSAYRITAGTWSGTPQKATAATSTSTANADPPNLTPAWGAADTLWIAAAAQTATNVTFTGTPTNYVTVQNTLTSGGTTASHIGLGTCTRQLNAASENPGNFTNGNLTWVAQTYAIQPAPDLAVLRNPLKTYLRR